MKKNDLTILALSLCLCLLVNGCDIRIGDWDQAKYERTLQQQAPLAAGSTVVAETSFGSVTVIGAEVADCSVVAKICGRAPSEVEAKELAEQVKIELEAVGNTLTVKAEKPSTKRNRSISISYDITVPRQTNIECTSSHGSIQLTDIDANVNGKSSSGSITAENIEGSADLDTSYGSINCNNISGGDIELKTSSGKIGITKAAFGNCSAHTSFGSVTSSELTGKSLTLKSNSGNIKLTEAAANTAELTTSYGRITGRQITADELTAKSGSGSIDIVCSDSAPAEIKANVVTSFGSIDFVAPPGFSGQVELATNFGSINTNLPITITGDLTKRNLTGKIGEGRGKLHLETKSGSIRTK